MSDSPLESTESLRFQEACHWFIRLREKPESGALIAEWLAWCRSDSRNSEAFEEARSLWVTMGMVPPNRVQTGLSAGSRSDESMGTAAVHRLPVGGRRDALTPKRRLRSLTVPRAAMVAATVAAISVVAAWIYMAGIHHAGEAADVIAFSTAPRERRTLTLPDGSNVEMAGDSKLRVRMRKHIRDIDLDGEAFFSVAHDKSRPFVVNVGSVHVRAVGTRFDVRTGDNRVVVAVEEGVVVVEPPALPAGAIDSILSRLRLIEGKSAPFSHLRPLNVRGGQEVAVSASENVPQLMPIEPAAVASWRTGRLRFAREPLRSVIAAIRAASGQNIELAEPGLGELRFTGTVFSSRVDAWVQALPAVFPVAVHQDGQTIVITPRTEPGD